MFGIFLLSSYFDFPLIYPFRNMSYILIPSMLRGISNTEDM